MADWRLLAQKLALVEGRVGAKETQIIKEELLADGRIDKSEFEFLIALRRGAREVVPEFDDMVFNLLKDVLLKDGHISTKETMWLKSFLMSDNLIDQRERQFLKEVKEASQTSSVDFVDWCNSLGI